ncbi:sensor histidine kinase [Altererythrobacter sp. KTW20L]|uniref:sensor histidine kinase n=1 Tax=Altererythrobacter sp. KTW20L TaxID=2942210 RepID=UPI0020BE0683|nr:sensor histidine kinase [Altererythrobacter sp. KTW20L]MCL6251321.1 sensor histidine kinase [Altererythrobacter sp. KTW20L]
MTSYTPATAVDDSLLLAVIHSSNAPLLLLDDTLTILAASQSFSRVFDLDAAELAGHKVGSIGAGEWNVPQLESLLNATARSNAAIDTYEMDLKRNKVPVRRLVVTARKLAYASGAETRLLVTVMDVTDARLADKLKDDLVREKAILLQELQHRVANSLQIIASVLMQSARRTQSEETRANLHDAHQRIMSVATLQQKLAVSQLGDVELRSYFTDLCRSIGASMIRDHEQISLDVTADDSTTSADVSISLGLIVTELVINALKHAFPGGRIGQIDVGYRADGSDWTMSVTDNGVGLPTGDYTAEAGLGTNIVAALASSLGAVVETTDAKPGVRVSIVHHES